MYNPSKEKIIAKRARIIFVAHLTHAATIGQSTEAREQLRVLSAISEEGRTAYEELKPVEPDRLMWPLAQKRMQEGI
jgi:hypothetical protein